MLRSLIFTTYYYIFWLEIVTMFSHTVILPTHAPKTDSFPSLNEKLFKRFKWLFRACLTKTWTVNWRGSVWSIWRCRWGCDRRLVYLWCGCHDLGIHTCTTAKYSFQTQASTHAANTKGQLLKRSLATASQIGILSHFQFAQRFYLNTIYCKQCCESI